MQTNCTAYAKVVINKRLNTVRLLVTFVKSKRDKHGNIIVSVQNAVFKSGDFATLEESATARQASFERVLTQAKQQLRTQNFLLV